MLLYASSSELFSMLSANIVKQYVEGKLFLYRCNANISYIIVGLVACCTDIEMGGKNILAPGSTEVLSRHWWSTVLIITSFNHISIC